MTRLAYPRERKRVQAQKSSPAVITAATRSDVKRKTTIRKARPRRADSRRWIIGGLCPANCLRIPTRRGCSSMAEHQLPKLNTWVRFPSPAPRIEKAEGMLHFRPRLLDELRGYDRGKLLSDVGAGVTVAAVALPLAMAFAIASGLKPEAGLFTAIVAGFLISALGGSRVQIGGPAGAFVVVVYAIVERYGVPNLLLATMLAGGLLMLMGAFRLGNLVRFVPVSIVIGFTNGIAVLIVLSQLRDFFGLEMAEMPADFVLKLRALARAAPSADPVTIALAVASLGVIWVWPRLSRSGGNAAARALRHVPGTVVGLALGIAAVMLLHLHVETIGTRFGGVPQTFPPFAWPQIGWPELSGLVGPAFTIALLGSIESLLCARVADAAIEDRHDPNQELMAQGIANIASPLFGGFCATGTIARTKTNVRSGAQTPDAGIRHAIVPLFTVPG